MVVVVSVVVVLDAGEVVVSAVVDSSSSGETPSSCSGSGAVEDSSSPSASSEEEEDGDEEEEEAVEVEGVSLLNWEVSVLLRNLGRETPGGLKKSNSPFNMNRTLANPPPSPFVCASFPNAVANERLKKQSGLALKILRAHKLC